MQELGRISFYFMVLRLMNFNNCVIIIFNYKLDYIKDIKMEDDILKPIEEVKSLGEKFNIANYINNHLYIFGGEIINAKLKLISNDSIMVVKDWFLDKARIIKEDGNTYAYVKSEERSLFYWLLQYQEDVVVIEPKELKEKVINRLKKTLESYGE